MIWFTSDTHFFHTSIIDYNNRPFDNVEEMNETIIELWNGVISPKDTIYHLGDFAMASQKHENEIRNIINKLKGNKFLIFGNHDDHKLYKKIMINPPKKFEILQNQIHEIKYNKNYYVMCHYPMFSWNRSHYGSYHLFGHHHGSLYRWNRSMDVGVDCTDYQPISIDVVTKLLYQKPFIQNHKKQEYD